MNLCNFLDSKYASRAGFHVTCYHFKTFLLSMMTISLTKFFSYSNYVWDTLNRKKKSCTDHQRCIWCTILKQNVRVDKSAFFISLRDGTRYQDTCFHFLSSSSFPKVDVRGKSFCSNCITSAWKLCDNPTRMSQHEILSFTRCHKTVMYMCCDIHILTSDVTTRAYLQICVCAVTSAWCHSTYMQIAKWS